MTPTTDEVRDYWSLLYVPIHSTWQCCTNNTLIMLCDRLDAANQRIAELEARPQTEQPSLPRQLMDEIFKACCCKPTPEEAQKEPCSCVGFYLVDQIEEWCAAEIAKRTPLTDAELRRRLEVAEKALREYAKPGNWEPVNEATLQRRWWFGPPGNGWAVAQQALDQIREKGEARRDY